MSWEAVAGISSAIIALCAFALTIWQASVQRQHNRLSVKPYLTTWSHRDDKGLLKIDVLNNGIGPALIKVFKVYVDSHEVNGQDLDIIRNAVQILFANYNYEVSYNSFLSEGYMMSAKEVRCLVAINFLGPKYPAAEEIAHVQKRVKIYIEYESIYKEKDAYDSSKFELLN
jgi:hypothetical protein